MDNSSMERIKDAKYSTAIVPKDVNASGLTVTTTTTRSNPVPL